MGSRSGCAFACSTQIELRAKQQIVPLVPSIVRLGYSTLLCHRQESKYEKGMPSLSLSDKCCRSPILLRLRVRFCHNSASAPIRGLGRPHHFDHSWVGRGRRSFDFFALDPQARCCRVVLRIGREGHAALSAALAPSRWLVLGDLRSTWLWAAE